MTKISYKKSEFLQKIGKLRALKKLLEICEVPKMIWKYSRTCFKQTTLTLLQRLAVVKAIAGDSVVLKNSIFNLLSDLLSNS